MTEFAHAIGLNPTIHVPWFIHTYYDVRGGWNSLGRKDLIYVESTSPDYDGQRWEMYHISHIQNPLEI